ncbi:MAG: GPMC system MBL fold metallohydrolase [Desulfuromonadales bacterium]|nr:GPMC system MBL fold metallohydrolase [Desulfuromonadales bacterium]
MKPASLDMTILGSGTSTGIPVVGCDCAVCRSADTKNRRTRCSALLSFSGHNILIDTSTDLRQQALREDIRRIDAVLYTHCHADHVHGIDDLRSFNLRSGDTIPIYGTPETLRRIAFLFEYIFAEETPFGATPQLEARQVEGPFELCGLTFEPIPLFHGGLEVLGYRCGPVAYLTDCNAIPDSSISLLKGLQLLVVDGLRFKPHPTHFNIDQAIEMAGRIGAKRTLLTHLSHDVDHTRHGAELPAGIEFAYDGQHISLPLDPPAAMATASRSSQS